MTRSEAITRINQAIGFRAAGNLLEANMLLMLQEAQRDLEKGKTLPKFLLVEDQTLTLAAAAHTASLPAGFIRESDENPLHFFPPNSTRPRFLKRRFYKDAVEANLHTTIDSQFPDEPVAPSVFVIRQSTVDFITTANQQYLLYWDYYKAADVLTGSVQTNAWLQSAPEWLWGEAGFRLSLDLGSADLVTKFDTIRKAGRAAVFGENIATELASGPLRMGANL